MENISGGIILIAHFTYYSNLYAFSSLFFDEGTLKIFFPKKNLDFVQQT